MFKYQIYELASSKQKSYMEKKEFFKALKMIGIYQEYGSLGRWEELIGSAKIKLPQFKENMDSFSPVVANDPGDINIVPAMKTEE